MKVSESIFWDCGYTQHPTDTVVEHGDLDVEQTLFEPMTQILEQCKSAKIAFRYATQHSHTSCDLHFLLENLYDASRISFRRLQLLRLHSSLNSLHSL